MADEGFSVCVKEDGAGKLATHAGKNIMCGLRPENISIASAPATSAPQQTVQATVEVVEPMGWETYLHLSSGGHNFVARVAVSERLAVHEKLTLVFDMSQAYFFDAVTEVALV